MSKKYFAEFYGLWGIRVVEVVRETEKTFWTNNTRAHRKETPDQKLCDTFEEAKQWLMKKQEDKVAGAKRTLARNEKYLKQIWVMEEK